MSDIVSLGSRYGYDVMVSIGESVFFEHRQAKEIQANLQNKNIPISLSEIGYLAQKFIIYLSIVHSHKSCRILEIIDENGGYILHLDALGGAKGGERLISGVDGISDIVLGNAKIKSENSDYIIPFLEGIKQRFGDPLAVVQDMGKGIMKAVETVFPNVMILICHFHFLRDIGKDLFGDNYDIIRKRMRHFAFLVILRNLAKKLKCQFEDNQEAIDGFEQRISCNLKIDLNNNLEITIQLYTLIEWILDWKSESNGYGFPFDRPHVDLFSRIKKALIVINAITDIETVAHFKTVQRLKVLFAEITEDPALRKAIDEIENEIKVFDKLRVAMRIAPQDGKNGLNDTGDDIDIRTIAAKVDEFETEITEEHEILQQKKGVRFMKQIDKYREQLFADPITVETASETKIIQPQRTNNLMEQMFRDFSRDNKRKTGVDSIGRTIQAMVDDTPLIRNLKNEQYEKMILGDKKNLAEVFAEIDISEVRKKMKDHNLCNEKIPPKIKSLLNKNNLLDLLSNVANLKI
ncbi:hypothetical protein KAH27_10365 [bacterium]|nr:hypothetical protein [bacterium]